MKLTKLLCLFNRHAYVTVWPGGKKSTAMVHCPRCNKVGWII